jgi:hypothetical protein
MTLYSQEMRKNGRGTISILPNTLTVTLLSAVGATLTLWLSCEGRMILLGLTAGPEPRPHQTKALFHGPIAL